MPRTILRASILRNFGIPFHRSCIAERTSATTVGRPATFIVPETLARQQVNTTLRQGIKSSRFSSLTILSSHSNTNKDFHSLSFTLSLHSQPPYRRLPQNHQDDPTHPSIPPLLPPSPRKSRTTSRKYSSGHPV
jgi:hypothetical protein